MPTTANHAELVPELVRLFHAAGLLGEAEYQACFKRQQKHKPILEVLTQDVSLGTLRDLLYAEVTLRGSQPASESLHMGLTSSRAVGERELIELLALQRPTAQALIEPLAADGALGEEAARLAIEEAARRGAGDASWLLTDGHVSAGRVHDWLNDGRSRHSRATALMLALVLARHNELLEEADFEGALALLELPADDACARLSGEYGLTSALIAGRIDEGMRLPFLTPAEAEPDSGTAANFPMDFLRRRSLAPVWRRGPLLAVATAEPFDLPLWGLLRWVSGCWVQPLFAPTQDIIALLDRLNRGAAEPESPSERRPESRLTPPAAPMAKTAQPAPARGTARAEVFVADSVSAVQLVSSLIEGAIQKRATDIHLEPLAGAMGVRYRIDGELHRVATVPAALMQPVVSRVKVLAELDVTERRRPQDGHFELRLGERAIDFRISTLPAVHGEKIVIRILDSARVSMGLDDLGLLPDQRRLFEQMIERPHGVILVTGPTGSGKTTTLYTALSLLNVENRNLVTIEDPVEYQLAGVNQVQVDSHIGMGFAEGLRSILRQDPDVIMVGEIRDGDTVQIAMRAALTGHLVLSTLHTNSALGTIDALVQLGAQRFMVAGAVMGILSQRLLRLLCPGCRRRQAIRPEMARQLGLEETAKRRIWRPVGCGDCLGSGYQGREGTFEVISLSEELRPLVADPTADAALVQAVRQQGMICLRTAAARKVIEGRTSFEEVARKILFEIPAA